MTTVERGVVLRDLRSLFDQGTASGLTDGQLLDRFLADRDESACRALLERHGRMVLGTCRAILKDPHEAEDAFQSTFLVFVHKATAIRGRDSLGGWLHRVAYNIALRANLDNARRQAEERHAAELAPDATSTPSGDPLLRSLVHHELGHLPERLRLPLVLCDLEGLSREEAARQLCWTEGMVRGRLAQGRARLRSRLSRRGLALTTTGLATCLGEVASAAVPEAWSLATARAANALVLGVSTTALVSANASRLIKLTLSWTTCLKIKAGVAGLLVLAGLGGVAAAALIRGEAPQQAETQIPPPAAIVSKQEAKLQPSDEALIPVRGKVLGPDGRAFKGARVFIVHAVRSEALSSKPLAVSDAAGDFACEITRADYTELQTLGSNRLIALADGLGFAISDPNAAQGEALTLRLVLDDVPIQGRVIDLQGKPVVGAAVRIICIKTNGNNDLSDFLRVLFERKSEFDAQSKAPNVRLMNRDVLKSVALIQTDAAGLFEIKGVGRERLVELVIEGPGIESAGINVATRQMPTIRVRSYRDPGSYRHGGSSDDQTYLGAKFEHVAGPSRPLEGIVFDRQTKRPLAGIMIRAEQSLPLSPREYLMTTTDAQGHYRLDGLPKGRKGKLLALPPADQPYMHSQQASNANGDDRAMPGRVDFELIRSVRVEGRVIDKANGKPARAHVDYFVFDNNPHLGEFPGFRWSRKYSMDPREDGAFPLEAFPGPGVVAARANNESYLIGVGAEKLPFDHNGRLQTHPYMCELKNYHVLARIDPASGAETVRCDLTLDPAAP